MKATKILTTAILTTIAGCSFYAPQTVLPDRIRTVKVEAFSNKTVLYGLEDKLYQEISDKLLADGRLIPTQKNPDAKITGVIEKYELIPLSYDANNVVEEYKLWIEANFKFIDLKTNTVLYEENDIPIDIRYYPPGSTRPGAVIETEQEAQDRAIKELASEIVYFLLRYK
ncbi:MAG: LptE family protein [Elusimicrobia bacterium]|nr:LptE family protein [Elusimicrobiota bacterium]